MKQPVAACLKPHHTLPLQKWNEKNSKNMCFCSRVKTSFAVTAGLKFPGKMLQTRWSFSREPFSDKKTTGQTASPESESSEPRNCPMFQTGKNTQKQNCVLVAFSFTPQLLDTVSLSILISLVLTDCWDSSEQNSNKILIRKRMGPGHAPPLFWLTEVLLQPSDQNAHD